MFNRQDPKEAQVYYLPIHGGSLPLSDHFVLSKFKSPDSDFVIVHPSLVAVLQITRDHFNAPVSINSAFRTPEHNNRIGGAARSKHLLGMAADITVSGHSPDEVHAFLEAQDVGGLGKYASFTHIDVYGADRRWDQT